MFALQWRRTAVPSKKCNRRKQDDGAQATKHGRSIAEHSREANTRRREPQALTGAMRSIRRVEAGDVPLVGPRRLRAPGRCACRVGDAEHCHARPLPAAKPSHGDVGATLMCDRKRATEHIQPGDVLSIS
jgi:hypothetical protein